MEEMRLVQVLERLTVVCEKLEERSNDHETRLRAVEESKTQGKSVVGVLGFSIPICITVIIFILSK